MLYELKLLKLSVAVFRLSAAHSIPGVKQLTKQPGVSVHEAGEFSGHQRAFVHCVQQLWLQKALFWKACPQGSAICFLDRILQQLMSLFSCCLSAFPKKWLSQTWVFTWRSTEMAHLAWCRVEKPGCQSSHFSLLTDSQGRGQISKWLSCGVEE